MVLKNIKESVDYIKSKTRVTPSYGVTLGSGLGHFIKEVEVEVSLPYREIPGFIPPSVDGHGGQLVIGKIGENNVAVLQGRVHYYEGHTAEEVIHPTRVLAALGVEAFVITNAAGGLTKSIEPGSFVILRDQINLTGFNPLRGKNNQELGPRFPDMSEPFDKNLSDKLESLLTEKKIPFINGIYCGVQGPSYETAAEVRYLAQIGGHCVGMSTVAEVLAARHMGVKVVGISCVTNLGTGLNDGPLCHDDVKDVAGRVEKQFCDFLKEFLKGLKPNK